MRARQMIAPSPASCLVAALAASPDVIEVKPDPSDAPDSTLFVTVRDSTAKGGRRNASIVHNPSDRPGWITYNVTWVGIGRPSKVQQQSMSLLADRLLGQLQAACAPGDLTRPKCEWGDGKWSPCAPAV